MSSNATCKSVMVVEDDFLIRSLIAELLDSEGYKVYTAENGLEAIQLLETTVSPCLVLLDMMMPVMNGWEFLEKMKKERGDLIATIPIVITSAAGDRVGQAEKEVRGFIKKPIDLEHLLTTVKKFCG